ncbi:hypothetical protein K2173_023596 [Erythroxylum novogranatense]|uniref:RING-type E3 ubiquitin transferase n=1 Tax=Erythroxylum novogranatense TaxID=1862640 RepID=A0AAV8TP86_9ROSI|nr:hypothetical protein K2173_023596 [Erythroxylum novogranatense]
MGNVRSHSRGSRRHHHPAAETPETTTAPAQTGQQQMTTNQYVFAAPSHYPNPNLSQVYQQHPYGHFIRPPLLFPQGYHRYPSQIVATASPLTPSVENQKAVTIRNDVNVKKETIRIEEDDENPGKFLLTFTFDAISRGSIRIVYFAKEGDDCDLVATKEGMLKPVSVSFEAGLDQKFRQPSGTGIDFTDFEETVLTKEQDDGVYPLAVKAEAFQSESDGTRNSVITLTVFHRKERGEYAVHVMKQILWVDSMRYELQEIYGVGNTVDAESDENDAGKECVICMSEPRDTTVLPCRHMCMCSRCAKVLQFRTNRCPICRQPIERLLEIKVDDETDK